MRNVVLRLSALGVILIFNVSVWSQITGAIAGAVVDPNGAAVPNATVVVKSDTNQEFTVTTTESGIYRVPALGSGLYTVTVTATGFKRSLVEQVKVDVGTPTTVNIALQTGDVSESVTVTGAGGEVLQTQTATVGATIQNRQIIETAIPSRDALDMISLLPGTATVGRPRAASINGLPKGALNISVDGVDAQDNANRSSDGFFTYIRPRVDAIEEVTVSTSNPGSESGGDGAVQIKFVTKRGGNDYSGGLFWQHRDESLNSNYWYLNRDGQRDSNGKAFRQKIRLNQYGGTFGGPIPFLNFGDGNDSWFSSGKDKRFFFVSFEEFRIPESFSRTRTILTPAAQAGNFSYVTAGGTRSVNLYDLALANGQLSTPDPTVGAALTRIRNAVGTEGAITTISGNPNRNLYNFNPTGLNRRTFFAGRVDINLTRDHNFEFVHNRQNFIPGKDFLNSRDEIFPGFPFQSQSGIRKSYTAAVRSNFGTNLVNEARYSNSGGTTDFFSEQSIADYDFTRNFFLDIGAAAGITNPYNGNSSQTRGTPTFDFTDSVTWILDNHNINFGGQYKFIRSEQTNVNRVVPTVTFGVDSTEGTAFSMFNATTLPNSTPAQQGEARALYAALVGRLSGYASNAYLGPDGTYAENGPLTQTFGLRTFGLFAQDNWRIRPGLSISFGIRWQPQEAFQIKTANVGRLEDPLQVFGTSGPNGLFQPGATGGSAPRAILYKIGEKAYEDDYNNFAPSFGFVWSPDFGDGVLGTVFGKSGRSVFRGGYSRAFVREGSALQTTITGNTIGGALALSRNTSIQGSFAVGTNLRDPGNPNLTTPAFSTSPSFPIPLGAANQALAVDPDLKTGTVDSFSFGYQRELDSNTVVEVRYVGNRGDGLHRLNFVNETNVIENGFGAEFRLAQANLYANIAANRCIGGAIPTPTNPCQFNFAYFGPGSGTSPLPIILSYFNTPANFDPSNPLRYAAANFANTALVPLLSVNNPSPVGFVGSANFENNAARRANAIANGRPANFFRVNPTVPAGSFLLSSDAKTWYDSAVIEVRRRLSAGLRVQASYVFSKARSDYFASSGTQQSNYTLREGGLELARNVQPFDVRHAFKLDATYDLPFGTGRAFFGGAGRLANAFVGGWSIIPTVRWQSGTPFSLGNVQLVGMTVKDLQKSIGVYKNTIIDGQQVVTYLPEDIILNTRRAFDINLATPTGYGATFGGAPTGRFIAPAGFGNCQSRFSGDCGFQNLIVYGPGFFGFDTAVSKKFAIGEKRYIELRATMLDALNMPSFRVGGWAADVVAITPGGATFGQMGNGSAYQDTSTTNNPGGRIIDLMLRINF